MRNVKTMPDLPSLTENKNTSDKASPPIQDASRKNYFGAFPTEKEVRKLLKNAMIIHQPMSVVGGDGYWARQVGSAVILIAFDCMGHGRLASMMTRIYLDAINQIVIHQKQQDPAKILFEIHERLNKRFGVKTDRQIGTGADMAVVIWNAERPEQLRYCGAKMDLLKVVDGTLDRYKSNKRPLGEQFEFERNYITEVIELPKQTARFYLFSDGITDLFGGPKNKKFKFKNLKDLLEEVDPISMKESKKKIEQRLSNWAGTHEPLDDMLLIGFEL